MSQQQTENSSFRSQYTDKWITPAQRLAELMCERMAKKDGATLPWQFWNEPAWKKPFLAQLRFANQVLRAYPYQAVFAVLESRQGAKVYSLGAKWLDAEFAKEAAKLRMFELSVESDTPQDCPMEPDKPTPKQPRRPKTQSLISRLQDLE